MRFVAAAFLLLACGCSAYVRPTPEDFRRLKLPANPPPSGTLRYRLHLSVDSKWLAGEFDGVLIVDEAGGPVARAQFFGDLGPKMFDLLARPDRITGYFPQTREGVDCALPRQAAPHPLLFLGVNLLEDFAAVREDRVRGVHETGDGWWLDLKPLVPGMRSEALWTAEGRTIERRFHWMYGVGWDETWEDADHCEISATGLTINVRILSRESVAPRPTRAFELTLPDDVKIVEGSRK